MSRSVAVSGHPFCTQYEYTGAASVAKPLPQRKIYSDVLAKWPKQDLRPDYQFQDAVGQVVEQRFQTYKPSMEAEELLKARALQYLQQNRFKQRVPLPRKVLLCSLVCVTNTAALVRTKRPNAQANQPAILLRRFGKGD